MDPRSFRASVPGSIMLLGEHAVLYGHRAIACAINYRIQAELTPVKGDQISILSDTLGEHRTSVTQLNTHPPFQFVLAAIKLFQKLLPCGFNLAINTEFSHQVGLGSSAAVTVATISLLTRWLQPDALNLKQFCFEQSLKAVHHAQGGMGSGADVAASLYGGIISIKTQPLLIEQVTAQPLPLALIYSGSKTPTRNVIAQVKKFKQQEPTLVTTLLNSIGECAENGYRAIKENDCHALGKIFDQEQLYLQQLKVSNPVIDEIIQALRLDTGTLGCKISGSGLGDCIISLGEIHHLTDWQKPLWQKRGVMPIAICISPQGIIHTLSH